jgi:hypothetical protein
VYVTRLLTRSQAEAIHKAQCLVLFEGLAVDLANGLDAVNALESEMQHLLMQVIQAEAEMAACTMHVCMYLTWHRPVRGVR